MFTLTEALVAELEHLIKEYSLELINLAYTDSTVDEFSELYQNVQALKATLDAITEKKAV